MSKLKRVLICGAPDLNYIDGSSIWAQTIALATSATKLAEVDFIAKSAPERDELFAPLKAAENLNIVNGTDHHFWQGKSYKRLTPHLMSELVQQLDKANSYDVIIIRGFDIATQLLNSPEVLSKCWMYLTDIPQALHEYSSEQRLIMRSIATGCRLLLCQTEGFKALWKALVPDLSENKYRLYTPVIPDLPTNLPPLTERPVQAIYAGKFKGDWMTLEMAEHWPQVHAQVPGSALLMIGDKIHAEPEHPDYQQRMRYALEHTKGLTWLGAQSREAVQGNLRQARVGLSWRTESMNDSVECSTKILEYGGAGCAAILNRNELHEELLGRDYPLFANSSEEFIHQLTRALKEPNIAERAAQALQKVARRHTFTTRTAELSQWLREEAQPPKTINKVRVLVAGHDLKFFELLQNSLHATGNFEFIIDAWQGHNKHNEMQSRALLENADVIFCEWCLGNITWYSKNKKPHQRLIARFHLQEVNLPYLGEANWDAIDHVSFVSEHTRRQALDGLAGFPTSKTSVIANLLDEKKFTPKPKTGDARYTLGIIGVAPKRKRLDRAIDLLEILLEEDPRYCLRVKGKNPLDYGWLLTRDDELEYYRQIFKRINSSPTLRNSVIFDPPGDDVNEWFTMVGFILSPSDFESYHMAVGEGILTGAVPIVWDWEGASTIWGTDSVIHSLTEAKQAVLEGTPQNEIASSRISAFQSQAITLCWENLIRGLTS
ncbi:glycosyltransferase family protein [Pseudomonas putida]